MLAVRRPATRPLAFRSNPRKRDRWEDNLHLTLYLTLPCCFLVFVSPFLHLHIYEFPSLSVDWSPYFFLDRCHSS